MALQTASAVRRAAFRSQCLSLAKNISIGLRSGECLGKKKSLAPAARMACRLSARRLNPSSTPHTVAFTGCVRAAESLLRIKISTERLGAVSPSILLIHPVTSRSLYEECAILSIGGRVNRLVAPKCYARGIAPPANGHKNGISD